MEPEKKRLVLHDTIKLGGARFKVTSSGWARKSFNQPPVHQIELTVTEGIAANHEHEFEDGECWTIHERPYRVTGASGIVVCLEELSLQDERNEAWSQATEKLATKSVRLRLLSDEGVSAAAAEIAEKSAFRKALGWQGKSWPADVPTIDERLRRAQQEAMAEGDIGEEQHLGAVLSVFDGALSLFMKNPDRYSELFQQAGIVAREALADAGDPVMQWPVPADAASADASRHASRLYGIPPGRGDER